MRIGDLAELAGVTTRTVRHYHHVGLLPEPERRTNGYRSYQLRDVVLLLRARRLVDLGLSLDEVADVLVDDRGKDLREILTELDADLADQAQRIQEQRDRIAHLLAGPDGPPVATDATSIGAELADAAGPHHPGVQREQWLLEVIESLLGKDAPQALELYRQLLANRELREHMLAAMAQFEQLATASATDPAVEQVADQARELASAVDALLPTRPETRHDPQAADRLLQAAAAGMSPAQARCLQLMVGHWTRLWS